MPRPEQSEQARKEARAKHIASEHGGVWSDWVERHELLYEHQGGRCMYCREVGDDLAGPKPMIFDEEHEAPFRIRGLAHGNCNRVAGVYEQGWRNPPAYGVVDYEVPEHKVAAKVQRADMARTRRQRAKGKRKETPGERTTYTYPDRPSLVDRAMRELEGVTVA